MNATDLLPEVRRLPIHPIAKIFPLMEGAAFTELVEDIKANGLRDPLVLYAGAILDGRNRMRACESLGIEPATRVYDGADPLAFAISTNLRRRHLKDSQRALIAARLSNIPQGGHRGEGKVSRSLAAQMLNVTERTLDWGRQVELHAAPAIKEMVERGRLSVSAGGKIAKLSESEQAKLAVEGPAAVTAKARKLERLRGRQGRSEYSILWKCVDDICEALEAFLIGHAHMAASKLVRELERVAKTRRS